MRTLLVLLLLVGRASAGGLTFGVIAEPAARGPSEYRLGGFTTAYTYDPGRMMTAGWFAIAWDSGDLALDVDTCVAHGDVSGTALQTRAIGKVDPGPFRFAGDTYELAMTLRLGARLTGRGVAVAGGSGIGFQAWIISAQFTDVDPTMRFDVFADRPDGPAASWLLPLWAAATIDLSDDWGAQLLAQYDLHPTARDFDGFKLGVGLVYQP